MLKICQYLIKLLVCKNFVPFLVHPVCRQLTYSVIAFIYNDDNDDVYSSTSQMFIITHYYHYYHRRQSD